MSWIVVAAIIGAGKLNQIRFDRLSDGAGPNDNGIIRVDTVGYLNLSQPLPLNQQSFTVEAPLPDVLQPAVVNEKEASAVPLPVPDTLAESPTMTPASRMYVTETTVAVTPGTRVVILPGPAPSYSDTQPAPPTNFGARHAAQMPEVLRDVSPQYPEQARALGIEGRVLVDMWLRKDGAVSIVQIFKSSGNALLDSAAARAASMCTFRPARNEDGSAVNIWVRRQFTFSLSGVE
jgi:protein TonB